MALGETNLPRNLWRIGEDFSFDVPVNTTGDSTGTPVTVSAYALSFVFKAKERDAASVAGFSVKTTGNGKITFANGVHPIGSPLAGQSTGGTNDMAKVDIDASDHANINPGRYFWALWRTDSGAHRRLAFGTVDAVLGATE